MFTRRVGCQQVTSFVAPPRTFHPFLGIGVGATISWGGLDVEIEPRGAESRSILPRYVLKNGNTFECNVSIMWNPLYSHNWWTLLLPDRKVGDGGGPIVTVGDRTLY